MTDFNALNLISPILKNLQEQEYNIPTPVQAEAIPHLLAGKDLLACAQTGTGKTAAFALPILQRLSSQDGQESSSRGRRITRALVLSPTRELASQIGDSFRNYGRSLGLSQAVIFGGVSYRTQIQSLYRGVDILVATPGRLLDLIKQGIISLKHVETFVIDEADQMFDMGFLKEVQKIVAELPEERQTVLFSATMPNAIAKLADKILRNPEQLRISPQSSSSEKITQQVLFIDRNNKSRALNAIIQDASTKRAIVFSRTKHGADRIVEHLLDQNIESEAIHGDKKQAVRRRILENFKRGKFDVLVATDVAARGIDVDGITHVINYDLPHVPENYVHRIGRTGRAGADGVAISFCDREERAFLNSIERLTKKRLMVANNTDFGLPETMPFVKNTSDAKKAPFKQRSGSSSSRFGDKPRGERSESRFGHKPRSERSESRFAPKSRSEGGESRFSDKPRGERSESRFGDKPRGERSEARFSAKPKSEGPRKPFGEKKDGKRPFKAVGKSAGKSTAPKRKAFKG
ncbi:MAG: DEAD/DEAH box helicase [Alphaproteobacteria bacterium]|nr:DEAD/DEAH box helicase [Alphaproteobacteria bacterium]